MTEAKYPGLVERVVSGNKRVSANDPETGVPYFAQPGETVFVQAHTAKAFSHCLTAPEVAEARVKATQAEKAAEAAEADAVAAADSEAKANAAKAAAPKAAVAKKPVG
jgi:hypothetical protein